MRCGASLHQSNDEPTNLPYLGRELPDLPLQRVQRGPHHVINFVSHNRPLRLGIRPTLDPACSRPP